MSNKILQLESKIDPKALYSRCIEAKPKTRLYSEIRIALIGFSIFVLILLSSLVIGLNFLEINNPYFDKEGFGKITSTVNQEQTLTLEDIFDSNPGVPTQKKIPSDTPYPVLILQGFAEVVVEIASLILTYSLEFVLVGIFLLITCYWIYRVTDWPLTNNKLLLLTVIIILTICISLGFLTVFNQNKRIPRILRETRDYIRETLTFNQ